MRIVFIFILFVSVWTCGRIESSSARLRNEWPLQGRSYYLGTRGGAQIFFNPGTRSIFSLSEDSKKQTIGVYDEISYPLAINDDYIVYSKKKNKGFEIEIHGPVKRNVSCSSKPEMAIIVPDENAVLFSTKITEPIKRLELQTGELRSLQYNGVIVGYKRDTVFYVRPQPDVESNLEDLFFGSISNNRELRLVMSISYEDVCISKDARFIYVNKYRVDKSGGFYPVIYSREKNRYASLEYKELEGFQGPYWSKSKSTFIFYDGITLATLPIDPPATLEYIHAPDK